MRSVTSSSLLAVLFSALMTVGAAAQTNVAPGDIQRLQDHIYTASRDISALRADDSALAAQLEGELDEARDETIYLKVKLRKNEPVVWADYAALRDRIDSIRTRARRETPAQAANPPERTARQAAASTAGAAASSSEADIPVGTQLDVRLQNTLSSATAQVEQRFEATTMVDVREGDRILVPAGSVMRGVVSSVTKAGRIDRTGKMTLAFDQLTVNGRPYPLRATVMEALESEGVRGEATRIGAGAGVGAIIGGILGGFKGALTGILIGAGGTIAATEGTDVELPAGTVLRVRLDTGLDLR